MRFTTKQPHSQCVTFRTLEETARALEAEAKENKKSVSGIINAKLRISFSILFKAAKREKGNGN